MVWIRKFLLFPMVFVALKTFNNASGLVLIDVLDCQSVPAFSGHAHFHEVLFCLSFLSEVGFNIFAFFR